MEQQPNPREGVWWDWWQNEGRGQWVFSLDEAVFFVSFSALTLFAG